MSELTTRRSVLRQAASVALAASVPLPALAAPPAFDAPAYLAEVRALGAHLWLVRDVRTGDEGLNSCYPAQYPPGITREDYRRRTAQLNAQRDAAPDAFERIVDELRREGSIYEFASSAEYATPLTAYKASEKALYDHADAEEAAYLAGDQAEGLRLRDTRGPLAVQHRANSLALAEAAAALDAALVSAPALAG